jgi:hypothetical protein
VFEVVVFLGVAGLGSGLVVTRVTAFFGVVGLDSGLLVGTCVTGCLGGLGFATLVRLLAWVGTGKLLAELNLGWDEGIVDAATG